MKVILALFFFTLIGLESAHANRYYFVSDVNYGTMSDALRRTVETKVQKHRSEFYKQYQTHCSSAWLRERWRFPFLGRSYPCRANIGHMLNGGLVRLIDEEYRNIGSFFGQHGRSHINYGGATINLRSPFRYVVDLRSLKRNYWLYSLDHKRGEMMYERPQLHQNLSIQYIPLGRTLWVKVCSELPGLEAATWASDLNGHIMKKFWIFRARADFTVKMNPGNAKFETAKICGAARVNGDNVLESNSTNIYDLVRNNPVQVHIEPPKISPLSVNGFRISKIDVRGANLLTRIVLWVMGGFKNKIVNQLQANINAKIQHALQNQVRATNANIQSGQVWQQLMDKLSKTPLITVTRDLTATVARSAADMRNRRAVRVSANASLKYCYEALARTGMRMSGHQLSLICRRLIRSIGFHPFYRDPVLANKGCYSFQHLIFNPARHVRVAKNEWWRSQCKLRSVATIDVHPVFTPVLNCFRSQVSAGRDPLTVANNCRWVMRQGLVNLVRKYPHILNSLDPRILKNPYISRLR